MKLQRKLPGFWLSIGIAATITAALVQFLASPDPEKMSLMYFIIWPIYLIIVVVTHTLAVIFLSVGITTSLQLKYRFLVLFSVLILVAEVSCFVRAIP